MRCSQNAEDRSLSSSAVDLDHDGNVVPADSERDQVGCNAEQMRAPSDNAFARLPLRMELGKLLVSSHARLIAAVSIEHLQC